MVHERIELELNYDEITESGGHHASISTYVIENSPEMDENRQRPAVLICPGGGYGFKSSREREPIAIAMNGFGFQAFTLDYSVAPSKFPTALIELATAVALIRKNAKQWHVNPDQIIVCGFSAGGHLAASLGVYWHQEWLHQRCGLSADEIRPNGLLLSYPVIVANEFTHEGSMTNLFGAKNEVSWEQGALEKQVSQQVPPVFIWHTYEDGAVPVENALQFVDALRKHKVSTEVHIFKSGGHGLSLANEETRWMNSGEIQKECQIWIHLSAAWLKSLF
ncbi:MAG: alpha/beta hydrolase [Vallitaleaceae bacterium]|nr:alpha/beta hydrolase [Vallitaleaceae bacterium]